MTGVTPKDPEAAALRERGWQERANDLWRSPHTGELLGRADALSREAARERDADDGLLPGQSERLQRAVGERLWDDRGRCRTFNLENERCRRPAGHPDGEHLFAESRT